MSIPSAPTIASIVTEGLKRGGRVNPTATQITDATEHQFREVKSDIMRCAATHPYLQKTATAATTIGEQRYALPEDCNVFVSLVLLDGPDEYRGTCQSGSTSSTIKLDSDFPGANDSINGRYILITDGTGETQYRQVTDYVASTQVATITPVWTTTPDTTSTFLVVTQNYNLFPRDIASEFDTIQSSSDLGTPRIASVFADEFNLFYVPDRIYGLLFRYYADLDRLDEAGTVFLNLVREWRSVWIQGVAVKTMQRYDEDRYMQELGVYQAMLDQLTNQSCTVSAVQWRDV
jgi:hypothetical protein